MTKVRIVLFALVALIVLSGCYYKREVGANQVGLEMEDGVSIDHVSPAGRYSDGAWYAQLVVIDVSAQTVTWTDPDLVTRDKQPIGFEVSVTYARRRDAESVIAMWEHYNSEARKNDMLQAAVLARIPRVAKDVTTQFTLNEMLGVEEDSDVSRVVVQTALFDLLTAELAEIHVDLLDIGINNITPDPQYMSLLQQKANAVVAVEVAKEETKLLEEQLQQEIAQTDISIEQARRENLVAEERAKVFTLNERWYNLMYLERLANVFGPNDKVWFLPLDVDLTLLLSGDNVPNVVPVEADDPLTPGPKIPDTP